jgi:flagellar hook-basal body complex protein FliE
VNSIVLPSISPVPTTKIELPISDRLMGRTALPQQSGDGSFLGMLSGGIDSVNQSQLDANQQVHALLTGENVSQAEVLTAVQKSDMSFRLLIQVRNKLMAAYDELNSIRV